MTKQDEISHMDVIRKDIREGIRAILICGTLSFHDNLVKDIMDYLHKHDVVLKAEGKLPKPKYPHSEIDAYIWEAQTEMLKAGYTVVEPLVL